MKIELAGLIIDMEKPGEYTEKMCEDYLYKGEKPHDIFIPRDMEAVKTEQTKYPDLPWDYLENVCIYRKICHEVINFGAILIHSAAVVVDGRGYLFTALSGTGKTTHAKLWLEKFKERASIVNGDKPIIKKHNEKFHVYGTPWAGKEGENTNVHVPIEGICILERGSKNHIERVNTSEAFVKLMEQTVRPKEKDKMVKVMDILGDICENIPIYRLFCNISPEAAEVSYNGMCKKQ